MQSKDQALVKMKKSAFIKEHKHLLKVLRSGKGGKKEAKEQAEEMKKYAVK